jgi:hypothetical protein
MSQESLPHGEFEITESPRDAFRGLYASMGPALYFFLLIWLGALGSTLAGLWASEELNLAPALFAVVGTAMLLAFVLAALRARGRSWTIRITDQAIGARRDAGELTLNWAAIDRVNERAGMMVLSAARLGIVLPIHRMSEVQVAAIRERLRATGGEERAKKNTRKKLWRLVVLWALLILMFVAIYNLMSPPAP